jgi:diacylglycerol kinase
MGYIRRQIDSFGYAFRGFWDLFRSEPNARFHAVAAVVVVAAGWYFDVERWEWAALALAMALVIALEAANTAIEYLTDLVSPDYHPLAGKAKDVAAAAVLIGAFGAVAVGVLVFGPRLLRW